MSDKFIKWLAKVDDHLIKKVGLTHLDLPDGPFADWFDDGISPATAARLLLADI